MLIQDTAQYNVAELDCRRPFPEPARRVTLELERRLWGKVKVFGYAFHGIHAQFELSVRAHESNNGGSKGYGIRKDETRFGWRQFILVRQRLSIQRQGRAARHRRPQSVEAHGEPVGQSGQMELRRVRPIDEASEALRKSCEGAVEGPQCR